MMKGNTGSSINSNPKAAGAEAAAKAKAGLESVNMAYVYASCDYDLDAMLAWLRARLTIPVVTGLPFGHVPHKVTLPVGAQAHLVSHDGVVQLHLSGYPTVW